MKPFTVLFCLVFPLVTALSVAGAEKRAVKARKERPQIIIMKPKFVEGEVGKPAIIIIPRASLVDRRLFDKSYHNDILRELYLSTSRDISEYLERPE